MRVTESSAFLSVSYAKFEADALTLLPPFEHAAQESIINIVKIIVLLFFIETSSLNKKFISYNVFRITAYMKHFLS